MPHIPQLVVNWAELTDDESEDNNSERDDQAQEDAQGTRNIALINF